MTANKFYVGQNAPKASSVLWLRPLQGDGVGLYTFALGKWKPLKLMNTKGTSSPLDDTPIEVLDELDKKLDSYITNNTLVSGGTVTAYRGINTELSFTPTGGEPSTAANLWFDGRLRLQGNSNGGATLTSYEKDKFKIVNAGAQGNESYDISVDPSIITSYTTDTEMKANAIYSLTGTGSTKIGDTTFKFPATSTSAGQAIFIKFTTETSGTPNMTFTATSGNVIYQKGAVSSWEANTSYSVSALCDGVSWIVSVNKIVASLN